MSKFNNPNSPENVSGVSRRSFMGSTIGAAAGIGAATLVGTGVAVSAQAQAAEGPPPNAQVPRPGTPAPSANPGDNPPGAGGPPPGPSLFRVEVDIRHCEIEGTIPSGLNGAFYRVGP